MPKTLDQVFTEITEIFRNVLNNPLIQLKYETTGRDVPEWDSLSHIELVVAIEKYFNIRFNFNELQKFRNVGEMCDNIVLKLSSGSSQ